MALVGQQIGEVSFISMVLYYPSLVIPNGCSKGRGTIEALDSSDWYMS